MKKKDFLDQVYAHYSAPSILLCAENEELLKKGATAFFRGQLAQIHLALSNPNKAISTDGLFDRVQFFNVTGTNNSHGVATTLKEGASFLSQCARLERKLLSLSLWDPVKKLIVDAPLKLGFCSSALLVIEESESKELTFRVVRPASMPTGTFVEID